MSQKKESQAKVLKDLVEIENECVPTQDMYHNDSSSEVQGKIDSKTQLLQLEMESVEVEKNI